MILGIRPGPHPVFGRLDGAASTSFSHAWEKETEGWVAIEQDS